MNNKLPVYPLINIDPFCSIWSKSDVLNDGETELWCGLPKLLQGYVYIDGHPRRFLGMHDQNVEEYMWQTKRDITPLVSTYSLECGEVRITVKFHSLFVPSDIYLMSLPANIIDYEVESIDGHTHDISVNFLVHQNFCSQKDLPVIYKSEGAYGYMKLKNLIDLVRRNDFKFNINFHTKGKIIYWRDVNLGEIPGDRKLADIIGKCLDFEVAGVTSNNQSYGGGFENWFRQETGNPGICCEMTTGGEGDVPYNHPRRAELTDEGVFDIYSERVLDWERSSKLICKILDEYFD